MVPRDERIGHIRAALCQHPARAWHSVIIPNIHYLMMMMTE
jgi:hypothetical protein